MANLVIVESPTKASTIKSYLGSGYKVIASKGHVRDLPKSELGVDISNNFEAHYINIRGKSELINEIKKEAKKANKIYLATDPDREGEAISWHLANVLGIPVEKTLRAAFNSVNKENVRAAIKSPRTIDMNLVNAQQARRVLDRIVGYKLSPYLWKRIKNGLSAGRTQSVATRIIVEREEEIRAFKPEEFWTIDATLEENKKTFTVRFFGTADGKKLKLPNEEAANKVVAAVNGKNFTVSDVKRGVKHKAPAPPFTTSTLQQEAVRKLGFQSSKTMKVAQELYEGVNLGAENGGAQGLITYMRTDSMRIAEDAQRDAREFIINRYGDKYCPAKPRNYKAKNGAQDAHEAIRPVKVGFEPTAIKNRLTADQFKLYKLIWDRFIASQMQSAEFATVSAEFTCSGYLFRTSGYTVTFPGYLSVYSDVEESSEDGELNIKLPTLKKGDELVNRKIDADRHFTEAPPRYTEGSLVKFLEDKGIGRPSTFSTIITTIIDRDYVRRDGKVLVPTELGEMTTKLMKESFADIVDYKFTANMEDKLDDIEKGTATADAVLGEFWKDFSGELDEAEKAGGEKLTPSPVETDIICEKCGAKMVIRKGKFGEFAACPNYPKCRNTKPLGNAEKPAKEPEKPKAPKAEPKMTDEKCEICGAPLVIRSGRFGEFYACSNFPTCRYTRQIVEECEGECPNCGGKIIKRHGRNHSVFYGCSNYPKCNFSSWDIPTGEKCPKCGKTLFRKKGKDVLVCITEGCGFEKEALPLKKDN